MQFTPPRTGVLPGRWSLTPANTMRPEMWHGVISSFISWDNPGAPNDLMRPEKRAVWAGTAQPTTGTFGPAWGADDNDANRLDVGLAAVARLQVAEGDLPLTVELVVDIPSDGAAVNRGLWTNSRSTSNYSGLHVDFTGNTGVVQTLVGDGLGALSTDRRSNFGTRDIRGIGPLHILCVFIDLTEVDLYLNGVLDTIASQSGTGASLGYENNTAGGMMGDLRPFADAPAIGNKMYVANVIHRFVGPQEAAWRATHLWDMFAPAVPEPALLAGAPPPTGSDDFSMIILNM